VLGVNIAHTSARQGGGRRVARRNLVLSLLSELVGFSVWTLWSVLVLFMSPEIGLGFRAGEKSSTTGILLVPTLLAIYVVQRPGTPLWVFLAIGALASYALCLALTRTVCGRRIRTEDQKATDAVKEASSV
jgi:nitrate/nitrite transporter NarK